LALCSTCVENKLLKLLILYPQIPCFVVIFLSNIVNKINVNMIRVWHKIIKLWVDNHESIAHNDEGCPRIKMKVFPTPQWIETWVYEGIVN
jgi:hypothetical protein